MKNKLEEFLEKLIKEDVNGFARLLDVEDIGVKNVMNRLKDPKNGGLTLERWNAYEEKSGYVVSIKKDAIAKFKLNLSNVKTWKDVDNETKKQFKNFINEYRTEYGRNIGFWYDKVKKEVVLDEVVVKLDREEAEELGRKLDLDAIYDLVAQEEIRLDKK